MKIRILSSIPIILLVLLTLVLQNWLLIVFAVLLNLLCQYEITHAFYKNGIGINLQLVCAFTLFYNILFIIGASIPFWYAFNPFNALFILISLSLFIFIGFLFEIISKKPNVKRLVNTVFLLFYPQMFFIMFFLLLIHSALPNSVTQSDSIDSKPAMLSTLLLAFLPAIFSDTLAYFYGYKYGKRKFLPLVSPNKTIEGCLAGLAGGAFAGIVIWLVTTISGRTDVSFLIFILFGIILAFTSQIGDLAASLLKRYIGIKDYGKILPGHGGVLDRIDGILFCFPIVSLILSFVSFV